MRLKVEWWDFYGESGGYYVFKHSWLWGWERYDGICFRTKEDALKWAREIKGIG